MTKTNNSDFLNELLKQIEANPARTRSKVTDHHPKQRAFRRNAFAHRSYAETVIAGVEDAEDYQPLKPAVHCRLCASLP